MSPSRWLPGETLLNRDLSWLNFNDRVLSEAADPSVPTLERLRFATIVSSNLDEFFAVRVAEIARLARRYPNRRFPEGLPASQVLTQIREHVLRQKARQAVVLDGIFETLSHAGIHLYSRFESLRPLDAEIQKCLPAIKTTLKRSIDPLPFLESERIHVFLRFPGEYAILTIQDREARLLELPSSGRAQRFALLERWLCGHAKSVFPDKEIIEAFPFKIIREADLRYRPDEEETLPEQIVEAVKQRTRAKIVRLEVDAAAYTEGALFLATALGLDSAALYRFELPLDLRTLAKIYHVPGHRALRYPPMEPMIPAQLKKRQDIFDVIKRHDILLHHPYDSFEIVVNFLKQAAVDPQVTRIYHSMYRTSAQSPIVEALKQAAARGKSVTAYVELKARFDELNNVRWANELKRAGVHVVRPFGSLKVHSKVTQVFRQENNVEVSYLHVGTGNYHPTTAKQYTDLGLLTADAQLGQEIATYFDFLKRGRNVASFGELLVAPRNLHSRILRQIREETRLQRSGSKGHIIAKMNALVDPDIINALYEASCAGVKIDLLIRGICCLRPGIRGLSENIRVISIIDRFLEHSRIYYFHAGGAEKLYLSSADWMPRNFYSRMEIAVPIRDVVLKRYLRDVVLTHALSDSAKSWALHPDGNYSKAPQTEGQLSSQFFFTSLAESAYRDTILENRLGKLAPAPQPK